MLSAEAATLARLILARQTLICRAIELDAKYEILTVAPEAYSWDTFHEVFNELALMPALLENLELEIAAAQQRLEKVSPARG